MEATDVETLAERGARPNCKWWRFAICTRPNLKTSRAWSLKETFVAFWDYRCPKSAAAFFDAGSTRAVRSRIEPIKIVTKMLRRHCEA